MDKNGNEVKTEKMPAGKKRSAYAMMLFVACMVIAIIAGFVVYYRMPSLQIKKHLMRGERYLSEMNYKEAIAAFMAAYTIDLSNTDAKEAVVDAYLAWADALVEAGDLEEACKQLEEGMARIEDERLSAKLEEIQAILHPLVTKQTEAPSNTVSEDQYPNGENDTDGKFHDVYDSMLGIGEYVVLGKPFIEWDYESYITYIETHGESTSTGNQTEIQSYIIDGMSADIHTESRIAEVFDSEENLYSQIQEEFRLRTLHHYDATVSSKYPILGMRVDDFFAQYDISMQEVDAVAAREHNGVGEKDWYVVIDHRNDYYLVEIFDQDSNSMIRFVTSDGIIQTIMIETIDR